MVSASERLLSATPPPPLPNDRARQSGERPIVSDLPLVEACLAGERHAARALYDRYANYVWAIALRALRHHADAEDAVQDIFTAAFQTLPKLRDLNSFRPWLAKIAVRTLRRRAGRLRFLRAVGLLSNGEETESVWRGATSSAEARSELRAIERVLAGLPAHQRLAWLFRYADGETVETVAELCDCSLATVKRWLASADAEIARATGGNP